MNKKLFGLASGWLLALLFSIHFSKHGDKKAL